MVPCKAAYYCEAIVYIVQTGLTPHTYVINNALLMAEFAIDWERACDVRCIAVVLSTHVKQAHCTVVDNTVVGSTCMSIVECCGMGARSTYLIGLP